MKTKYGLVGCGMMGQEHLRNLALLDDVEVTAVYDPDVSMAAQGAALAPSAQVLPDLDALIQHPDLDAIVVASPNDCHADQLARIVSSRPLPVLLEKPLFTDAADSARIAALAARHPAPLWVAMEYRYMPPIAAFLAEAQAVTGGVRMLTIREHRYPFLQKVDDWNRSNSRTGGTLVEKCCHFFDLMRLVLQAEPVRVMASGAQDVNHIGSGDVWDNAYVIVDFDSGARAMLELCMFAEGSRYQEEISAVGPLGKIEVRVPGPTRFWNTDLGAPPVAELEVSPRNPSGPFQRPIEVDPTLLEAGDHNGSTYYQHVRFLQAVRGVGPVEVTVPDGLAAVNMGLAAQTSALAGKAVDLAQPVPMSSVVG